MARTITSLIRERIEHQNIYNVEIMTHLYFILDKAEEYEKRKIIADFEFGMLYQRHDNTMTGEKYYNKMYLKTEDNK